MSLQDLVNLNISLSAAPSARANFGTPLVAASHSLTGPLVRSFGSLSEAESAGIVSSSATTRLAHALLRAAFNQNPRPRVVKLAKRAPWVQVFTIVPTVFATDRIYNFYVFDALVASYTVLVTDTTATLVATGIQAALNAIAATYGWTVTRSTSTVTVTGTSGRPVQFDIRGDGVEATLADTTADTGLDTELTTIEASDNAWYALISDVGNKQDILDGAAWIETRKKVYLPVTADSAVGDGGSTTDVGAELEALDYTRTFLCWHPTIANGMGSAWAANRLVVNPGTDNWAFKALVGIRAYKLSTDFETALRAKNVNTYTEVVDGSPVTLFGIAAGGDVYGDTVRGIDWLHNEMQLAVYDRQRALERIGYDDTGAAVLEGAISKSLAAATSDSKNARLLAADPAPAITMPRPLDQSPTDRANRHYPNIEFTGRVAGAINTLDITGRLTP